MVWLTLKDIKRQNEPYKKSIITIITKVGQNTEISNFSLFFDVPTN